VLAITATLPTGEDDEDPLRDDHHGLVRLCDEVMPHETAAGLQARIMSYQQLPTKPAKRIALVPAFECLGQGRPRARNGARCCELP